jgi:outer membrane protein
MSKKLLIIFFSIILLYCNISTSNELKIVYVDIDKIISQSEAGKQISKQLENLNNNNIKKFKKKEKEIADEEKNIIKQKNIMPKDEFEKKVKILQKNIENFKRDINTSRQDLDKKRVEATTKMLKVINPILSDYSSKNLISLIIQKKYIVIGKSELDVTSQILKIVNTKIKTVKLN